MGCPHLPITIGKHPRQTMKILTFLIADCPSAYNVILGCTTLNAFQPVTSTYLLAIKFLTDHGVDTIRGEQTVAREYYVASLKKVRIKEAMIIEGLDVRDEEELIGENQWKIIKGQTIANFILEFINLTPYMLPPQLQAIPKTGNPHSRALNIDGSSRKEGSGAGLILTTPKGEYFKCALRFLFDTSNNEAEYEALIAGLRLARDIGVDHIQVFNDSQLVVGLITGEFDAKEETMRAYRDIVIPLVCLSKSFQIRHIPRSENS
ncbi:uncharacterized protein LOC114301973 [Camellia sinensis]|uniref:uncharacterized protein LOC114301973 n=1 Tax=Camellia sinensis TaxID=4442 RepID=UPI0010368D96|nr:uncharacterized protein LOC114301973 [Camellia sinensis]